MDRGRRTREKYRRDVKYVYHVHAIYNISNGVVHHDMIVDSNRRIKDDEGLAVLRGYVTERMSLKLGYTPEAGAVVIDSFTFLHEV